jgi:proteasome lid subunit RPN8/RPN11
MSIKLNGYNIPEKTINQMKTVMNMSKQINSELGFALCADHEDNLQARNICTGKSCNIEIESKCKDKEKFVGTYHTHPTAPPIASANDLTKCGTTHNICIGGADNRTVCYMWKHEHITTDKYNEFIKVLTDGIDKINDHVHEKNFECIKDFGQPSYIERVMPEINEAIEKQYQELTTLKKEKAPKHIIEEAEKTINTDLDYRSKITLETLIKIAESTPKYYKEQVLW